MNTSLIFQRTNTGRAEIHEKRHGLTQSERLVLIMVDGITSFGDVRKKLPVLREERFARAFNTLIKKDLIVEVFLPVADQSPDTVERTVIDRFLQQDPLDPVTIIVYDLEEELGEPTRHHADTVAEESKFLANASQPDFQATVNVQQSAAAVVAEPQAAMDEHHRALADSLTSELHERRIQGRQHTDKLKREYRTRTAAFRDKDERLQLSSNWPYWSIGLGLAFIAGFVAAKL